jgi:hypothetical protein
MGNQVTQTDHYDIRLEDIAQSQGNLMLEVIKPLELLFLDPNMPDGKERVLLDHRLLYKGKTIR